MFNPIQRQVLRVIVEQGPLSRTELADQIGVSKAALTVLARDLLDFGALQEAGIVHGPGRPSVRLGLNPEGAAFAGLSLLEDPAILVLTDFAGAIIGRAILRRSRDPVAIGHEAARALPRLAAAAGISPPRLVGLGVALSGLVDQAQASCLQSTLLGWQDVPVAAILEAATGLPTIVENDAKAMAVSERQYGLARDCRSFSLVSLGEGIGCAHFIDGRLHRGHRGGAGEIAHCTIEPDGTPCRCGKRGCLDTIASTSAILAEAAASGLTCAAVAELEAQAAAGQVAAIRILHRAGAALGLAIAHLIQINDPEMILIVHEDSVLEGLMGRAMRQAVEAHVLPRSAGQTRLALRRALASDWARAAAHLAAHHVLKDATMDRP